MQIEIEKKYNLTDKDYYTIQEKCEFVEEITLKDYYLDKEFILAKQNMYLRLRNGLYELKKVSFNQETQAVSSEEYDNEEEIEAILGKDSISTDEVVGIMFIETQRKKYTYKFNGQSINIDVEQYQYGERYEVEIVYQEEGKNINRSEKEAELNKIIEDFRTEIGLTSESDISSSKTITCAMHQNIDLYEIMTEQIIK